MRSDILVSMALSLQILAGTAADVTLPTHCADLAAAALRDGQSAVAGRDGWLYLAAELRYMGAGKFWGAAAPCAARSGVKPEYADPLPAILDFHAQLRKRGVKLLLVPVPPKCLIFPDKLPSPAGAPAGLPAAPAPAEFYEILRGDGIQVLDLAGLFWEHRMDTNGPPYCRTDSHWSGNGCVLAARAIAEIIRSDLPAASAGFDSAWSELEIHGDLTRMPGATNPSPERLTVRRVGRRTGDVLEPVAPDPASPVILLGDSHNLVFHAGGDMHAAGAGLPDQLALELGRPVALAAVRGSGATPARVNLYRRAASDAGYWQNRRWVVWCFAAREFTESDGWRKIPIAKAPAAGQP